MKFRDKFGNRKVLVPSLVIAVVGYIIMAFWMPTLWAFALIYLGLVSLGNSMAFQHACFAGLNQWFQRRRALAISVSICSSRVWRRSIGATASFCIGSGRA